MTAELTTVSLETPAVRGAVDRMIVAVGELPPVEMPIVHRFTPGLYIRQIFMPKGTLAVSKLHKTEHPYVISQGRVSVWMPGGDGEVNYLSAPHTGVTKPGTRRVLYVHEDTLWTTFHPTTETDLGRLEALLVEETPVPESLPEAVRGRLIQFKGGKVL